MWKNGQIDGAISWLRGMDAWVVRWRWNNAGGGRRRQEKAKGDGCCLDRWRDECDVREGERSITLYRVQWVRLEKKHLIK